MTRIQATAIVRAFGTLRLRTHRGALDGKSAPVLGGLIAIFLAVIIAANTLPTALGTLANSTLANSMKNVDAGTLSLYKLIGLFAVIAIALLILKGTGII